MGKEQIIKTIQSAKVKNRLKKLGIKHVSLFGSFARGDQKKSSDIDLLYEEDKDCSFGFFELYDFLDFLQNILGRNVDFVSKKYLNHRIKDYILSDKIDIL